MGIDEGKIIIKNKEINDGMNSSEFISVFSSEVNSYVNGDSKRFNFINPQIINGLSLWVKIVFNKEFLRSIELKNADPTLKNSYENWSDNNVELKRKSHDEWLMNQLGQPSETKPGGINYNYTWGEILSFYDPRGGDTGILINYYKQNA